MTWCLVYRRRRDELSFSLCLSVSRNLVGRLGFRGYCRFGASRHAIPGFCNGLRGELHSHAMRGIKGSDLLI